MTHETVGIPKSFSPRRFLLSVALAPHRSRLPPYHQDTLRAIRRAVAVSSDKQALRADFRHPDYTTSEVQKSTTSLDTTNLRCLTLATGKLCPVHEKSRLRVRKRPTWQHPAEICNIQNGPPQKRFGEPLGHSHNAERRSEWVYWLTLQ